MTGDRLRSEHQYRDRRSEPTLGFACHWGSNRAVNWSGTSLRLFDSLGALGPVRDLDVTLPTAVRTGLKAASARRRDGAWHSKWRHGPVATAAVEFQLRRRVCRSDCDAVLQIQDLGRIEDRPYAVLQDLSYDLLLEQFGDDGVPHFRTLSRGRIERLRDRQREIYAGAALLFPMSQWLADSLIAGGVDASRVHVVHPAVNVPLADALVMPRRQGTTFRLLFLGRDFDTKAGPQVLAAFARLRATHGERIELTIAGPKVWPMAATPGPGVTYLGPVGAHTVQQLYDSHDLFVMPSHFEGFGIAFVEALVRGLPCVGREACAMPEIITPGDGGLLVGSDSPDALAATIEQALGDDDLYAACAAAAPARRQYWTWSRAAEQVHRAFVDL